MAGYTFCMCGRFRVARKKEILETAFDADGALDDVDWAPRYNVAPGQEIVVVRQDAAKPVRRMSQMRWGLIPSWASDPSIGYKTINARGNRHRHAIVPRTVSLAALSDSRRRILRMETRGKTKAPVLLHSA